PVRGRAAPAAGRALHGGRRRRRGCARTEGDPGARTGRPGGRALPARPRPPSGRRPRLGAHTGAARPRDRAVLRGRAGAPARAARRRPSVRRALPALAALSLTAAAALAGVVGPGAAVAGDLAPARRDEAGPAYDGRFNFVRIRWGQDGGSSG